MVQLLQNPEIQLPGATPASLVEQRSFGTASHSGWAVASFSLGQACYESMFKPTYG